MLTYRVLSHIPDFVPLGGMVLGGVWWITHRREEVAFAEGRKSSARSKDRSGEPSNENETANKNGRKL
jgi:formate dehydrogenase iron-sulfur subunit